MSSTGPGQHIVWLHEGLVWLPGERLEVALDSRTGAVAPEAVGRSSLMVTTHRAIKVGLDGGKRTTSITPLDRVSAVEVTDTGRPTERLAQGLIFMGAGALLGWISWVVLGVALVSLLIGGLPILASVYMLAAFAFPDEDGELTLYAGTHVVRQPLLSAVARRDAYAVAQRIYELTVAPAAATPGVETPSSSPAYAGEDADAGLPARFPVTMQAASAELDALMGLGVVEAELAAVEVADVDGRVRRSVSAASGAAHYVTQRVLRAPALAELGEGDFVWVMEFASPDARRVRQTAWPDGVPATDQWATVGGDFYRILGGTWVQRTDAERFADEAGLGRRLQADAYAGLLLAGAAGAAAVYSYRDRTYLRVEYRPLPRRALSRIIDDPSPPQALQCQACVWLDLAAGRLAKVELTIEDADEGPLVQIDQVFVGL